jgi:hypothetical protein
MLAGLVVLAAPAVARAEGEGPVIVIPSRPGVPVVINGRDASYAVVEGDWVLSRPGAVPVTVIGGGPLLPNRVYHQRNSYHPKYGHAPPRGRHEIEPAADRALPDSPESFSRSWSTSSEVSPVREQPRPSPSRWQERAQSSDPPDRDDTPAGVNDPQPYNPPVIVVPRNRRP